MARRTGSGRGGRKGAGGGGKSGRQRPGDGQRVTGGSPTGRGSAARGTTARRTVARISAAPKAEAPRLPKGAPRVHDAVDLAGGRIETASTARAPGAATRLRRLARFGFKIDLPLFGPSHRLTPQKPYQATPEAWLDAFEGNYGTGPGVDRIWWRLPATFPNAFIAGVNLNFRGLAAGAAVLSLKFEAWPYQGRTGTVVVDIGAQRTEFPIGAPAERTVDIAFVHDGSDHMDARVLFRQGLLDFVFREASVGGGPFVVLDPTLVLARTQGGR